MATTTPNFGWAVPTSTDLVKDGAVAIETLGDSIDASLVDLKGGTTGQVLAKASGTDMDFSWTAIDPLVILDAKGDLITATAADTPARLAVGTNGQTLVADSTASTGLKWATPASSTPTFVGVGLRKSADQSISNATFVAITWNTEEYDTDAFHSTSTNNERITIPTGKGGYYLIAGAIRFTANGTGNRGVELTVNGTAINYAFFQPSATSANSPVFPMSYIVKLNAGDYIELFVYQNSGISINVEGGSTQSKWQMQYLGA